MTDYEVLEKKLIYAVSNVPSAFNITEIDKCSLTEVINAIKQVLLEEQEREFNLYITNNGIKI